MGIRKRTLVAWGMAVVSLVLLVGALGMAKTATPAAAQVDWCERLQQSIDAFNRGEIDLMLEDFADDMVFVAAPVCVAVECVGKDAYRNLMQHFVERKAQATVTSCEVSGNTVAITLDWACDPTRAAGVDRIVARLTYEIEGEQVVAQRGFNDPTDRQTAQFNQYWLARPNATFEMGPGRDADQSPGIADMREFPDLIAVAVRIAPGPAGVPQPMHIHEGTCANLGPVALSLRDVDRGLSWTTLRGVSLTDLQTGNFAIAVQKSRYEPDVYVACADIPAAAAQVPPAVPAPAAEEAPAVEGGARVLVTGSPIHGANGLMFDAKDRLYIASLYGREIVVMDPETGEILDRLGPEVGVESPDDLTFGPDGSLYWTALLTGEVGRLSPDGVKTGQSVALGVNPITFSDDGRLFVALDLLGDALYELDPDLIDPPRLIAENLGSMNGMDWGPDGFLYGPLWTKGEVVRVDVDTGTVTLVADGFRSPDAVKFDSQGRLYVADYIVGEVLRVDVETGSKEVIATGLSDIDNIAFDSHDRLFVSHAQEGSIFEVLPDGITRTVSPGGMIGPEGVAVLPRASGESVFVADTHTLREFDGLTGEARSVQRHYLTVPGEIDPQTVSADGDHLVLSSWMSSVVQVWDPDTHEVLQHVEFPFPLNAIRFNGDLIVAGFTSVVRVSAADPEVRETLAEGLDTPSGLAATGNDLWVSERGTGRVLQIVADGKQLSEPTPVATGLSSPEGLAVTPGGNLLVVEAGAGRLSLINTRTGEVSTVAEGLELGAEGPPGMPPTWLFNGVAVGPSGAIYVTGDKANVLYRIEAVEEAPPVAAAPAALPAAGSGGLLTEQGSGVPIWWYALAGGGALLVLAGLAGLGMTRSRR